MRSIILICSALLILSNCSSDTDGSLSRSSGGYYMAYIEIPAGTNKKMEYDHDSETLEQDSKNSLPRVINYLPYPGNYGFVPGTKMSSKNGGDGDALDVLIICEALPGGTMVEFEPIGMAKFIDDGEIDNKIIGLPVDPALNIMDAHTFYEFQVECKRCTNIIQTWFENYSDDEVVFQGWEDEKIAASEIERWSSD